MTYSSCFNFCIAFLLKEEGGYTDDSNDPGNWTGGAIGEGTLKGTNFGISAKSYPNLDIANLTREQAIAIYYSDYWTPLKGDSLPEAVALVALDCAVNQGPQTCIKFLQSAVGALADGNFGPETQAFITSFVKNYGANDLVSLFLKNRLLSYIKDSDWVNFGSTWATRLFDIAQVAGSLD